MPQIVTGYYTASGGADNVEVGFVPDIVHLFNKDASTGDQIMMLKFGGMPDGDAAAWVAIADDGTTKNINLIFETTAGPADYSAASINTTPDPIENVGFAGFTVPATFTDDNDVVYFIAIRADRNIALGDLGA